MPLIRITEDNVDSHIALLLAHLTRDERACLEGIDFRARILNGEEYLFRSPEGGDEAMLGVLRTPHRDGQSQIVDFSVIMMVDSEAAFEGALRAVLDMDAGDRAQSRTYGLMTRPTDPVHADVLTRLGFRREDGRHKYRREAGPAVAGDFPLAAKALERGYAAGAITRADLDADPELANQLAGIRNRAFGGRPGATRDADDIARRLDNPKARIMGLRFRGRLAGYLALAFLDVEVLGAEAAVDRRHWGIGGADLLYRDTINLVDAACGKPICAYVDHTNAASINLLARAGFRRVESRPAWRLRVPPRDDGGGGRS